MNDQCDVTIEVRCACGTTLRTYEVPGSSIPPGTFQLDGELEELYIAAYFKNQQCDFCIEEDKRIASRRDILQ